MGLCDVPFSVLVQRNWLSVPRILYGIMFIWILAELNQRLDWNHRLIPVLSPGVRKTFLYNHTMVSPAVIQSTVSGDRTDTICTLGPTNKTTSPKALHS
ncbi:hypothetical protein J6590_004568 [Homalodisca vitripennis]|nr:hypothetical protein J6590_004568 [Homalodisca vitripennis]